MKDDKGHGSDPRGAHSQGVQAVGQQFQTRPLSKLKPTQDAKTNASIGGQKITYESGHTYNLEQLRGDIPLSPAENQSIIDGYRAKIRAGQSLDPIYTTEEGKILDGNHRHAAYAAEGVKAVPVEVAKGVKIGR